MPEMKLKEIQKEKYELECEIASLQRKVSKLGKSRNDELVKLAIEEILKNQEEEGELDNFTLKIILLELVDRVLTIRE